MTDNKASEIIFILKDKLPSSKLLQIKKKLLIADDNKYDEIMMTELHEPNYILLMSIFFGFLGVDRFILKDYSVAIGKLLLSVFTLGIWPLIDIFLSHKRAREINYQTIYLLLEK